MGHESVCAELREMYETKNKKYGGAFQKVRGQFKDAIKMRISDKYHRLMAIESDEAAEKDALMDMANYCIMELIEGGHVKASHKTNSTVDTRFLAVEDAFEALCEHAGYHNKQRHELSMWRSFRKAKSAYKGGDYHTALNHLNYMTDQSYKAKEDAESWGVCEAAAAADVLARSLLNTKAALSMKDTPYNELFHTLVRHATEHLNCLVASGYYDEKSILEDAIRRALKDSESVVVGSVNSQTIQRLQAISKRISIVMGTARSEQTRETLKRMEGALLRMVDTLLSANGKGSGGVRMFLMEAAAQLNQVGMCNANTARAMASIDRIHSAMSEGKKEEALEFLQFVTMYLRYHGLECMESKLTRLVEGAYDCDF